MLRRRRGVKRGWLSTADARVRAVSTSESESDDRGLPGVSRLAEKARTPVPVLGVCVTASVISTLGYASL